jgi:hypothetical protein
MAFFFYLKPLFIHHLPGAEQSDRRRPLQEQRPFHPF